MGIFARSLVTAIVPLSLLGLLTGLSLWLIVLPAVEDTVFAVAQEKQRTIKAQVTTFINSRLRLLEFLARNQVLTEGPNKSALAYLQREEALLSAIFEGLYYNELDGTVHPARGPQFQVADRPYFAQVKAGEAVIGEILTSRATQQQILLLIVPITSDGETVGALGGTVVLDECLESILPTRDWFEFQIAILEGGRVLNGFPEASTLSGLSETLPEEGSLLLLQGKAHRVWCSEFPEMPWRLVVAWPEERLFGPVRRALTLVSVGFIITFILGTLLSLWLQRSVTRPLSTAAKTLSNYQGEKLLHLEPDGPRELAILLQSINTMSIQVAAEIRKRLELEQQLSRVAHQESLGTMVDSIAHDFKNVLSAVVSLSALCLEETEEGTELYEDLQAISQSGYLGISMVEQLRRKTANRETDAVVLCFDQEFQSWAPTLQGLLPPGVTLRSHLQAKDARVRVDTHQLFQIILNLICNARDALSEASEGWIRVDSYIRDSQLIVDVSDSGPGVPPAVADKIFTPFFTTHTNSGSGLGLSTCVRLIGQMGGEISLLTREHTTFQIRIPLEGSVNEAN